MRVFVTNLKLTGYNYFKILNPLDAGSDDTFFMVAPYVSFPTINSMVPLPSLGTHLISEYNVL